MTMFSGWGGKAENGANILGTASHAERGLLRNGRQSVIERVNTVERGLSRCHHLDYQI